MYRTKVESVICKVGNQNLSCALAPGFDHSMISSKTLERIGCKVSKPITIIERNSKFFREMTTTPIGWAFISLTFTEKNRSITTETEVLVVKYNEGMDDEILLGSPWFMGLSPHDEDYLQIFKASIVVDMLLSSVRSTLYIRNLKGKYYKHKWVRIPITITYREPEKIESQSVTSSDEDTSSVTSYDTDASSDTSSAIDKIIPKLVRKAIAKKKK